MATVDVTNQPVVVEATNDVSIVAFTESSVVVEVPNPQPVVEFTAGGTLTAGTGLAGGGYLTGNITLGLSAGSVASLAKADTAVQPGANLSSFVNDLNLATSSVLTDAIAALSSVYQPLNSNLTAISAVATTVFGRSFLELADAAASRTLIGVYSTSQVYTKSEVNSIVAAGLIPVWGTITGSILSQTDLQMALSAKSSIGHDHVAAAITSGVLAPARLGSGTADDTKYLRGDGAWTVFPTLTGDHGGLTGLADDDHTQYLNNARGDARYSALGHTHAYLAVGGGTMTGNLFIEGNDPILWLKDLNDPSATTRYGYIYKQDGTLQIGIYNDTITTVAAYMNLTTGGLSVNGTAVSMAGHTHSYLSDAPSDGSQYARKNGAWDVVSAVGGSYLPLVGGTITGDLWSESVQPNIWLRESDAAADSKVWRFVASGGSLYFQIYNDIIGAGDTWLSLERSGIALGTLTLIAPLVQLGLNALQVGTALTYNNSAGYGANLVVAGTYHARMRVRASDYGGSGEADLQLWADNSVSPAVGINSNKTVFAFGGSISSVTATSFVEGGTALSSKYAAYNHAASQITSGLLSKDRIRTINVYDHRGDTYLYPTPNQLPSHAVEWYFNDTWGGSSWRSGFSVAGWDTGSYAVWQMSGCATSGTTEDWYLRVGLGATWGAWRAIFHSGNANVADNILFNNAGGTHGDVTDFNAVTHFGPKFIQSTTNGPGTPSVNQYYSLSMGLGTNYDFTTYVMQMAIPRYASGFNPVISVRYKEGGVWGSWYGIYGAGLKFGSGGISVDNGTQWRITTAYGYGDVGPANAGYFHFSTDRPAFYFAQIIDGGGGFRAYNTNVLMNGSGFYTDSANSRYLTALTGSYGAMTMVGSANGWAGLHIGSSYNPMYVMFATASDVGGFYNGSIGWRLYWNGTNWCAGTSGDKAIPWCDFSSNCKITAGTGAPPTGVNGDIHLQYT